MGERVALNKALVVSGQTRASAAGVHLIYVQGRRVSSCLERALGVSYTCTARTRRAQDGCLTCLMASHSTTGGSSPAENFTVPINQLAFLTFSKALFALRPRPKVV